MVKALFYILGLLLICSGQLTILCFQGMFMHSASDRPCKSGTLLLTLKKKSDILILLINFSGR